MESFVASSHVLSKSPSIFSACLAEISKVGSLMSKNFTMV